jgi:hypothetical protein
MTGMNDHYPSAIFEFADLALSDSDLEVCIDTSKCLGLAKAIVICTESILGEASLIPLHLLSNPDLSDVHH